MSNKSIATIAVAGLGFGVLFWIVSSLMDVYKTTVNMENALSGQYLSNQTDLSTYISGCYEQSGILIAQSDSLDLVLTDAVKGRYDGGFSGQGALFSAVMEAYPEGAPTALMNNWSKFQDYIVSQREGFGNSQKKLVDMRRNYNDYRNENPLRHFALWVMRFPSRNLEARIGTNVVTGEAAYNQISLIILTSDGKNAYESGVMDPLKVPTPTK